MVNTRTTTVASPATTAGPARFNLSLYKGDSVSWTFTLWGDTAKTEPIDLTGAAVAAQVRQSPGGDPAVSLVCLISGVNVIDMTLDAATSATVQTGSWDLQLSDT